MKRQILIFLLACVMIFGVLTFAGCNNDLKNQVSELQKKVDENSAKLDAVLAQLTKELADQKADLQNVIDQQTKDLQGKINGEKDGRENGDDDINSGIEASQEEWDALSAEMNDRLAEIEDIYNDYKAYMIESKLYLEEEFELLDRYYDEAKGWILGRARTRAQADKLRDDFVEKIHSIPTVPGQIYNKLTEKYIGKLITYTMRTDLVAIQNHYNRWIALDVTPEYYDAYLLENEEKVLDPTFTEVMAEFVNVIMPRSDILAEAVEDAEDINEAIANLKAAVSQSNPRDVEANWTTKEELKAAIRDWISTYFFDFYYAVEEGEENYEFELPETTTPDGTVNYQLINYAGFEECEAALYEIVDQYVAATRKFVTAVEAIGDVNLLSYGKIDVATAALLELRNTRGLTGEYSTHNFIFKDDGEALEPDYTESLAVYTAKYAAYKALVDEAYDAYMEIVGGDANTQSAMMKRIAEYYGYTTTDGYNYATTTAKNYFMSNNQTNGVYPVYGEAVDALLAWYRTYGVWDEETGEIVWDSTFYTDWSWEDDFSSDDAEEIAENATPVGDAITKTGYMMTYTGKAAADSVVWTVKATATAGTYKADSTTVLKAEDYAFITGFDKRVIEIAIEALFAQTPIQTGSESLVYVNEAAYAGKGILVELIADTTEQPRMSITAAKYIEKYDLLEDLCEDLIRKVVGEYPDVATDFDDYHAKMLAIEYLNARGMKLQAEDLADADVVAAKAIRKLLIEFVGDIAAACPADTAEAKSAVTEDIQIAIAKISKQTEAAFEAVVTINELYEGYLDGIDGEQAEALYNIFRIYVLGEQTENQPPKSWLRVFAVEDGIEEVEVEDPQTGVTYTELVFPGIERAINDVTAEFENIAGV